MAYNELIKNFNNLREYMREFYVYGFRSRDEIENEIGEKSLRTYNDAKRRIESYLDGYMFYRQRKNIRNVFISIDTAAIQHNPFYKALKAKSFTDGDITLHFILMDILDENRIPYSLSEILTKIDTDYLSAFSCPMIFDESTVRKKLNEYSNIGLVKKGKSGKKVVYVREQCDIDLRLWQDAIQFFSEAQRLGVVGSYITDKLDNYPSPFAFKHHYIADALDSQIIYDIFRAIYEKKSVMIVNHSKKKKNKENRQTYNVIPLKIYIGAGTGRNYLVCQNMTNRLFLSFRIDFLESIKILDECPMFDVIRTEFEFFSKHMWGASCGSGRLHKLEHIEMLLTVTDGEQYIINRVEKEKRCGSVEVIDSHTIKFTADLVEGSEILPWVKTFIGRIIDYTSTNKANEIKLKRDMTQMIEMYAIGGENGDI